MELITLNLSNPTIPAHAPEKRDGSLENPAVPLNFPVELEMDGLFGPTSDAGVRVSELTAMQDATVTACVRVRAEAMGQMPLNVFERITKNGIPAVRLAEDHDVHYLLHDKPNPFMSAPVWKETMQACLDMFGNGYAVIERDNANRPIALWPRNPKKVKPFIAKFDGNRPDELWYCDEDGQPAGEMEWWPAADMIHFVGLGFDGLVGLSPIRYFMKNTIGLAQAAEKFGARFYANNGRPGGVLVYKGMKLDPAQKETIRQSWQEAQAGKNQGRPAVLTGEWDWKEMNVPAEEAQFLQTRKHQAEQIAGMFRVPPHKIGILERSTNNNIEHQSIEFVRDCLGPQINKWQVELTNKLVPAPATGRNAGKKFFVKFDFTELLQGDFKTTMEALSIGLLNGTFSVNDALRRLNCNPIGPEGDLHTVQSQLTTLENLAAQAEAAKAQAKKTVDDIKNGAMQPADGGDDPADTPQDNVNSPDDSGARYSILFQDAFNRVCKREKRDSEVITKAFEPLLSTITADLAELARRDFRATALSSEEISCIVREQIAAMAKRAVEWAVPHTGEMDKALRSLRIAVFKAVAVRKAKGD